MKSMLMSLGHAAMHSPWLLHAPNPSASICATIPTTLVSRSGWPWGRSPRCDTFAATNSMADALGQAATQAPHPMQAAASIARSASRFGTRSELASGALPVRAVMNPPAWMMRSNAPRSDPQLGAIGEGAHVQLACSGGALRPVRAAVDHHAARPANPLAAVVVERDRLVLAREQLLVEYVEHLEERHIGTHVRHVVADKDPRELWPRLPPDVQRHTHYL